MKFKALTIAFLVILVFSCKNENSSVVFSEISESVGDPSYVTVKIPFAEGDDEASLQINQTLETFVSTILHIGDPDQVYTMPVKESISDFNNEYATFITDFPDSPMKWEADIEGEISYQSPTLICISVDSYVFTGGAHGMSSITFFNFDPQTGMPMEQNDLISDQENFTKVAEAYFQEEVIETDKILFEDTSFVMPENMGFDDQGVIFLYNPYEIGPYATGMIEFRIPYKELTDFIILDNK